MLRLAAAVIGDISTGEERGELIGVFRSCEMPAVFLAPSHADNK
jgi:hypothetical protein